MESYLPIGEIFGIGLHQITNDGRDADDDRVTRGAEQPDDATQNSRPKRSVDDGVGIHCTGNPFQAFNALHYVKDDDANQSQG